MVEGIILPYAAFLIRTLFIGSILIIIVVRTLYYGRISIIMFIRTLYYGSILIIKVIETLYYGSISIIMVIGTLYYDSISIIKPGSHTIDQMYIFRCCRIRQRHKHSTFVKKLPQNWHL